MDWQNVIGIDIGGANLKYARVDGRAWSTPFPMWKRPDDVAATLVCDLQQRFADRPIDGLAITITGELADCFANRAEGITHLVRQAVLAAQQLQVPEPRFYGVDGGLHDHDFASSHPDLIAAANWHALASFVGHSIAPDALLIDVGSTTTDIVPIADGCVATKSKTDHDRLLEGSLVYIGCQRTPVCALVDRLNFADHSIPVMNEVFATMDDAQLLLRQAGEDPTDRGTADGQPRTVAAAKSRMARMLGLDRRQVSEEEFESMAVQVMDAARLPIQNAIHRLHAGTPFVVSGHGHGLLDGVIAAANVEVIDLADRLNPEAARCAPSYAVAQLMQRHRFVSSSAG